MVAQLFGSIPITGCRVMCRNSSIGTAPQDWLCDLSWGGPFGIEPSDLLWVFNCKLLTPKGLGAIGAQGEHSKLHRNNDRHMWQNFQSLQLGFNPPAQRRRPVLVAGVSPPGCASLYATASNCESRGSENGGLLPVFGHW